MSVAQPSLFDQVYQQTFDFNRQAEQPRQQELNLSVENAKPTFENAKQLVRADKSCHKVNSVILLQLRFAPCGRAGAPRTPQQVRRFARNDGAKRVPFNHPKGYPLKSAKATLKNKVYTYVDSGAS